MGENLFSATAILSKTIHCEAIAYRNADYSATPPQTERIPPAAKQKRQVEIQIYFRLNFPNQIRPVAAGLSRPSRSSTIVDCWIWLTMTENLFSTSIVRQIQKIAQQYCSAKTSLPHRHRLNEDLSFKRKQKSDEKKSSLFFERKERDSNPRNLSVQRFSRPPQSTTLPSFRRKSRNYFPFCQIFNHFEVIFITLSSTPFKKCALYFRDFFVTLARDYLQTN